MRDDTASLTVFFLMIRRPPRYTQSGSSAASDVYKRQVIWHGLLLEALNIKPKKTSRENDHEKL